MEEDDDRRDQEAAGAEEDAPLDWSSHDDAESQDRPPPIIIPQSGGKLRRSQSSGSSPSSSSSSPSTSANTSRSRASSSVSELRSDREIITMVCSSAKSPEGVDALDLSNVAKKTRKLLKSLRALAEFTNLVQLNVSNNAIGSVDGVDVFTQLEALAMSRNHLKRIGSPLFTLASLRHLDLSGNFISHIPKAIAKLEQLETLNLSGNSLSVLKEVDPLGQLANLHECSFTANPFCKLPTYKDYVVCKLPSLEKLDDTMITVLVRDKSRRRFSEEMFSKDSRLREAGIAHENEQNKLREARSALEAENLRLKGELQVKSKLLQNKSKEWSSATGQLLQLQQEVAMLNLDRRGSVSPGGSGSASAGGFSASFSMRQSPRRLHSDSRHCSTASMGSASSSSRLSESFARATGGGSRGYDDHFAGGEEDDDLDFHLHQPICSISPVKRSSSAAAVSAITSAAVSPLHPNLRYSPPPLRGSLSMSDQFGEEVARSSPAVNLDLLHRHVEKEDHSSYSKRLVDSACSPLRSSSSPSPRKERETVQREDDAMPAPNPIAVSPQPGRSRSFDHVRRAFSELSPREGRSVSAAEATNVGAPMNCEVDLAEDDVIKNDMSINRSIRFPTFEDDLACPAYEDGEQQQRGNRSWLAHQPRNQHQQQEQHQSPSRYDQRQEEEKEQLTPPPSYTRHQHRLASSSPQRLLSSPSPSPRSKAHRLWKRQHDEFRDQTFGSPSKSPLKVFIPSSTGAGPTSPCASSPIDRDMLARQIQALQSCKQSLVTEIAKEEQLLHTLKQEANSYASQMDQLHLGIQVCLSQDAAAAESASANGSMSCGATSPRPATSKRLQRSEESYRAKLEFCRSKLRFAEDKEKEIEMTMVRTTKRVLQSDLQNTPFDKEIFALTHKLQQVIVQKEEIHQEMSRLMALMRQQQQESASDNDECDSSRRRSSGGGCNSYHHHQQTVDDMLEEEEQRQRLSAEHQEAVALARKRLEELRRRHSDVLDRIRVKEDRIASFVEELKDVEKELLLIGQRIPTTAAATSSPHPLRRHTNHSVSFDMCSPSEPSPSQTTMDAVELELAEALRHIRETRVQAEKTAGANHAVQDSSAPRSSGDSLDSASQAASCDDASTASTGDSRVICAISAIGKEGSPQMNYELRFKELLTAEMLEEIKKDIYERLSRQLAEAAAQNAGSGNAERSVMQEHKDLHEAIAVALETQMKLAIESFYKKRDDDDKKQKQRQKAEKATSSPSPSRRTRQGGRDTLHSAAARAGRHEHQQPQSAENDTPKDDDIACDQLDDFVPVDASYARKYRFVKYRSSSCLSPPSPTGGGSKSSTSRATGTQRILKACERLEQAESDCKIDSISAIEVDPMGNKRSSLKVLLMGARDLPTSHLRTKNLDPYVSLEIVYPEHIVPAPASSSFAKGTGNDSIDEPVSSSSHHHHRQQLQQCSQSFRSRTKKKSVYPVWDEEFEFTPVLSLKGYLHVRILNDRRLSREQLVGEVRIPLRTLLHQKKMVEWFPLRSAVASSSGSGSDAMTGTMSTIRKTSTILRTSGGTIRLQLQLSYSRLEKYKRAVDELVTKFFHEHNQLPPFIESAAGQMATERRKQHGRNQEQHNEEETDAESGDAMSRRRFATREDAEALEELQYQQQQQLYGGVPEVESPAKDSESAMPTFDSWKAERGVAEAIAAARQQRLRDAHDEESSGEISPQRTSTDVMIASHIYDSELLGSNYVSSTESFDAVAAGRRLSAERSKRLWESRVSQESHAVRRALPRDVHHTGQSSAERSFFYPEPASSSGLYTTEKATGKPGSTFAAAAGRSSQSTSVVRHAVATRSSLSSTAIASTTKATPSAAPHTLLSRTPRAGNSGGASRSQSQSFANPSHGGRRKTTGTSQRPECFDDYSPYHPDFQFADVLDLGGNNDHFASKKRRATNLYAWQAASSRGGVGGGVGTSDDDASRKTDLRIFKSPGFARRQPTSGFPERYIGLDNQTCERLKRMFGRMDGGSG